MRSKDVNFLSGPLFSQVLIFSLPLALTGILQLLFNAADTVVVGKFAGPVPLAAVGATATIVQLLVGTFNGMSIGANILTARALGARQKDGTEAAVHTAVVLGTVFGLIVMALGLCLSERLLLLLDTPAEILPLSVLYLRIYFLGQPANILYNFSAAVLRSIGDTKRPLLYLTVSGVINAGLNLLLVIVFHMDVAGVAIATVVSQYVSLFLILRCLCRETSWIRLDPKKLRLNVSESARMIQIGLPAGLQAAVFNISNMMIQSAVNTFGATAIAANTAGSNVFSFQYIAMNSVSHAAVTFSSQNYGAGQYSRMNRILGACCCAVTLIGLPLGGLLYFFGPQLLSIYLPKNDPCFAQFVEYGMLRIIWMGLFQILCGYMEVAGSMVRGLGKSWLPMVISAAGSCIPRIIWLKTAFVAYPTLSCVYLSYPISWLLTALIHLVCYAVICKRLMREERPLWNCKKI